MADANAIAQSDRTTWPALTKARRRKQVGRRIFFARAIAGGVAMASAAHRAQGACPGRPIAPIVATPVGGVTGLIARHDVQRLALNRGQQISRESKEFGRAARLPRGAACDFPACRPARAIFGRSKNIRDNNITLAR
ncbi:MAG: hypothetical protein KIS73_10610 [Enhydrobacter sp.]|nr:hypothetical protein [Enhydrobacter sp.]